MVWKYMLEGGYINPLFRAWYSFLGIGFFFALWAVLLILFFISCYAFLHNKAQSNSLETDTSNDTETATSELHRWVKATRLLLTPERSDASKWEEGINVVGSALILVGGALYLIAFFALAFAPDWFLTTRSLQQLSAADFEQIVYFLYRFGIFGFFLMVANLTATLRVAVYLFA